MPDDRWRALGLGRQPAPGPRVPGDPDAQMEGFLGRLGSLLGADQPSLASRMQDLSRMQRTRLPDGTAPGPPLPGTPEFDAAVDIAGALDFLGPIKAYHGSPHTFDAFSLGRVGTGEGAQAYGHGLYFAESPGVAESYRRALSKTGPVTPQGFVDVIIETKNRHGGILNSSRDFERMAGSYLANHSGDARIARQMLLNDSTRASDNSPITKRALQFLDDLDTQEAKVELVPENKGALYQVNLAVEPEDLLDWDLPLSQQPEKVRKALLDVPWVVQGHLDSPTAMPADIAPQSVQTAQAMRAAGIPGLRYLDQGSRAGGEGSRNIVLFDEALAEILERNGQPVPRK